MIDRRSFLRALGIASAGLAAHTLDLDRLLWVPGAKTILLPPPPRALQIGDLVYRDARGWYHRITPRYEPIAGAVTSLSPLRIQTSGPAWVRVSV